jgi:hypothetical protein
VVKPYLDAQGNLPAYLIDPAIEQRLFIDAERGAEDDRDRQVDEPNWSDEGKVRGGCWRADLRWQEQRAPRGGPVL